MEQKQLRHVDSTILNSLKECPRKCQQRFVMGQRPRGIEWPLVFGRGVHAGLHGYYQTGSVDQGVAKFLAEYKPIWEAAIQKDVLRTPEKGKEVIEAWVGQLGPTEGETVGLELNFALDLGYEGFQYVGIIDRVEKQGDSGVLAVHEWKTSKSPGYFVTRPNLQGTGYLSGLRSLMQGVERRMVFTIAGIYKSSENGIVPARKKNEPGRSIFTRDLVDLDDWDFDEWQLDVREGVDQILKFEQTGYWPKNTGACSNFGGCPFNPICVAPPQMREQFFESSFQTEFWTPAEERR